MHLDLSNSQSLLYYQREREREIGNQRSEYVKARAQTAVNLAQSEALVNTGDGVIVANCDFDGIGLRPTSISLPSAVTAITLQASLSS